MFRFFSRHCKAISFLPSRFLRPIILFLVSEYLLFLVLHRSTLLDQWEVYAKQKVEKDMSDEEIQSLRIPGSKLQEESLSFVKYNKSNPSTNSWSNLIALTTLNILKVNEEMRNRCLLVPGRFLRIYQIHVTCLWENVQFVMFLLLLWS